MFGYQTWVDVLGAAAVSGSLWEWGAAAIVRRVVNGQKSGGSQWPACSSVQPVANSLVSSLWLAHRRGSARMCWGAHPLRSTNPELGPPCSDGQAQGRRTAGGPD